MKTLFISFIQHLRSQIILEAKPYNSHQFLVPLSAQMPLQSFINQRFKGITAAIGAILSASFCRSNFSKYIAKLISILIIGVASFTQVTIAQIDMKEHYVGDIVYFKSGSKFFGKVLNILEDNTVEFEMLTGKVIYFNMKVVQKIVQKFDEEGTAIIKSKYRKPYAFKEQGIYNFTYINLPQGFSESGDWISGLGIHHVTGKQHNRWHGTGIGIGFDGYEMGNSRNIISLYGDYRGYTSAKNFSPYYSVGLGYGLALKNRGAGVVNSKGGLFINPSLGFRFGGSSGANFTMGLGYKLQTATFSIQNWNGSVSRQRYNYRRLNIYFGVLF